MSFTEGSLRCAARNCQPSIVDIMMPTMDGWQFRAAQRSDPSVKDIPVVILTAHADADTAAEQMDAAGFLMKPVALDLLLGIVERFCAVDQP